MHTGDDSVFSWRWKILSPGFTNLPKMMFFNDSNTKIHMISHKPGLGERNPNIEFELVQSKITRVSVGELENVYVGTKDDQNIVKIIVNLDPEFK